MFATITILLIIIIITPTTRSAPPTYGAANRIENEQLAVVERVQVPQQQQQPTESAMGESASVSIDRPLASSQQPSTSTANTASSGVEQFQMPQQQQQQPAEPTTSASTSDRIDRTLTSQQPTTSTGNIASNPAGQDMFAMMNQFLQFIQNQPKE